MLIIASIGVESSQKDRHKYASQYFSYLRLYTSLLSKSPDPFGRT